AAGRGQLAQPLLQADEELVLDPGRVLRLLREVLLGGGDAAERLVGLVDGTRDREPEQERDRADDRDVVERDAERARYAAGGEPLDPGPHRGGDDQPEEDERDHDLELPDRERKGDDGHRDKCRDERLAGGVGHGLAGVVAARQEPQTQAWRGRRDAGRRRSAVPAGGVSAGARRAGVVLARPLAQSAVLGLIGAVLLAQPWPLVVPGAAFVVLAAAVLLRAVWRWDRTRLVVT